MTDHQTVVALEKVADRARAFLEAWKRGEEQTSAVDEANELEDALCELDYLPAPLVPAERLIYSGIRPQGGWESGSLSLDTNVAEFVEKKFRNRWRALFVTRSNSDTGERTKVGQITPAALKRTDTNKKGYRTWWAEGIEKEQA